MQIGHLEVSVWSSQTVVLPEREMSNLVEEAFFRYSLREGRVVLETLYWIVQVFGSVSYFSLRQNPWDVSEMYCKNKRFCPPTLRLFRDGTYSDDDRIVSHDAPHFTLHYRWVRDISWSLFSSTRVMSIAVFHVYGFQTCFGFIVL